MGGIKGRIRKACRNVGNGALGYLRRPADRDESVLLEKARTRNASKRCFNKIFCIGANKTGTTSLERALRDLGFRLPRQETQEERLTHLISTGEWAVFRDFCSRYQAFQDLPFSVEDVYIACDVLFPNSKFILTLRDEDAWFSSLVQFHKGIFGFEDEALVGADHFKDKALVRHKNYFFEQSRRNVTIVENNVLREDWSLLYDKDFRVRHYRERNERVRRYFANRPGDLLILDVTREIDTSRIVEFLELDKRLIRAMPRLNSATTSQT